MSDLPNNNLPKKRTLKIKGVKFTLERDHCHIPENEPGGPLHEIALSYNCHEGSIEVMVYGAGQEAALLACATELYHLAQNHRSRCGTCQEVIVYNLIGDEDDLPPEGPASDEKGSAG